MNKKKISKRTVIWTITIIALLVVLSFLFMSPSFYYIDGQIRVFEPEEIDVTQLENPGNLDERSLIVNEMSKWAEKKSLFEIAQERASAAREERSAQETASETNNKEETVLETEEDIGIIYGKSDPKDEHDEKYANQFVGKVRGDSEEFFKDTENRQIVVDFGKGNYDITDCVVKWMYGEPIVSLNKISKIMGLELSTKKPDDFLKIRRSETYLPEDAPELDPECYYNIYLKSPQGDSIRYLAGSTIQEDNHYYAYLNTYQVEGSKSNNYETLVSISEVPYYDGTVMKAGVPMSYKYSDSQITITFGDPEDSSGYLAMDVTEISEEEYEALRGKKATGSNASKEN